MDFKGLTEFDTDQYLAGDSGVIVYLESTDDEFIFRKWFGNQLSKIEFKAVSGEKANGGCRVVISKVQTLNDETTQAACFGVVDRDALLTSTTQQDQTLWWETDDDTFFSAKPFGQNVFVLSRWELENYLLHPKALYKRLENRTMGDSAYADATALADDFRAHEDEMIAVTVLATLGRGDRHERYAQNDTGDNLWSLIKEDTAASDHEIDTHKNNILQFAQYHEDPLMRWDRLSRMLDGKRAMIRIDGITGQERFSLQDDRGTLADHVVNLGLIDPHLATWIQNLTPNR